MAESARRGAPALLAIERFLPPYRYEQEEVTGWVRRWLEEHGDEGLRLLSVYSSAGVKTRASVAPIEAIFNPGDFEQQNDRYREAARCAGIDVARRALAAAEMSPQDVGIVVSVSCTGFMIPSLDAHLTNHFGFSPHVKRLPITELGCAAGAMACTNCTSSSVSTTSTVRVGVAVPGRVVGVDWLHPEGRATTVNMGVGSPLARENCATLVARLVGTATSMIATTLPAPW